MDTKTPQYVQGYYRNKQDEIDKKAKTQEANTFMAAAMLLACIGLMAVVFWQVTLTLAGIASTGYMAYRYYKIKTDPTRLVINYMK